MFTLCHRFFCRFSQEDTIDPQVLGSVLYQILSHIYSLHTVKVNVQYSSIIIKINLEVNAMLGVLRYYEQVIIVLIILL